MEIVVKGRKAEVPDGFREHAGNKLAKLERFDHKIMRLEVEVCEERNPRQSHTRERVEVTCISRGPVVRAEAAATDVYSALDLALDKLEARLRRAADKRHGHHAPRPVPIVPAPVDADESAEDETDDADLRAEAEGANGPAVVVRDKTLDVEPVTVDDALLAMELVGHDFYLFRDADTGLPSVVYRRKGYDYGVIRLKT